MMPPIETEPIDSDSDDDVQFEEAPLPEPSRTPPRHHHHHRRHHRHHQNHHRDSDNIDGMGSEQSRDGTKDRRISSPGIQVIGTPTQPPPTHDEDSRMSLVSEPEKTSGSNFVPFAMGGSGNRNSDHNSGNKTPASPNSANNLQGAQQTKKKTRMDVKDVFNNDDDDDGTNNSKKRKLVPLGNFYFYFVARIDVDWLFFLFIVNFQTTVTKRRKKAVTTRVKEVKKKARRVKKKKESTLNLLLIKYQLIRMLSLVINSIGRL